MHHPHLPETVFEILSPQRTRARPREVPRVDQRTQEDLAALLPQAVIELVVLISDQFLVEAAGFTVHLMKPVDPPQLRDLLAGLAREKGRTV